ncbi:MAG: hypothetical protein GF364_09710 [Candidatus Lokiarchaeota archaeon]|nr:hypothetical protein [Candidatus Lokiarchaeota archaeon]
MVFVKFSNEVIDFLNNQKKEKKNYLGIKITQEACLFGAEVYFDLKDEIEDDSCEKINVADLEFYIANDFYEYFNPLSEIVLEIKGRFKKKVAVIAPKPIIKNICKT